MDKPADQSTDDITLPAPAPKRKPAAGKPTTRKKGRSKSGKKKKLPAQTDLQRKLVMICMLLMKGQSPVIIDAPEEEFDNEDMVKYLVPVILECKDTRQILLFTNHPILAVNTDPDNYVLIPRQAKSNALVAGFAVDAVVEKNDKGNTVKGDRKTMLLEVLEGNIWAFQKRASRYE